MEEYENYPPILDARFDELADAEKRLLVESFLGHEQYDEAQRCYG